MTSHKSITLMGVFSSACSLAEATGKLLTLLPPPTLTHCPASFSTSGKLMPLMSICSAHLSGKCPTPTHCTKPHASPSWRSPLHRSRFSLSSKAKDQSHTCKPAKPSPSSPTQPKARYAKTKTNQQCHGWGGTSIKSMADTVQLLAPNNIYSPGSLVPPFDPKSIPIELTESFPPKGSAQPQGGSASGSTPATLPAPQPVSTLSEQPLEKVELTEQYNMVGKEVEELYNMKGKEEEEEEERPEGWCDEVVATEVEQGGGEGEGGVEKLGGDGKAECEDGAVLAGNTEEEAEFQFTFSIENLKYDAAVDEFSLEGEPVEFASPELRAQLLAKVKARDEDQAAATPPPEDGSLDDHHQLGQGELKDGPPKPLNLRHQLQRSTFCHLSPGGVKSLGRWTSWTGARLEEFLSDAFTKPRFDIFWSEYSPEEKLEASKMVDWRESFPDDPPPSYLLANFGELWSSMS